MSSEKYFLLMLSYDGGPSDEMYYFKVPLSYLTEYSIDEVADMANAKDLHWYEFVPSGIKESESYNKYNSADLDLEKESIVRLIYYLYD